MPDALVSCDCLSRRCGERRAQGGRELVSRSSWFRHKAADLLARRHLEEDGDDMDIHTDPLHVPPGSIDEDMLADLEDAGLFIEVPEQVIPLTELDISIYMYIYLLHACKLLTFPCFTMFTSKRWLNTFCFVVNVYLLYYF